MIIVEDEILNGEVRYRIRDKSGNILFDNLTIEMITETLKKGTELNKLLFGSINDHLDFISLYHKLNGIVPQEYSMPSLTNNNRQGYVCSWSYSNAGTNNAPETAYEMFGGDGSKSVVLPNGTSSQNPSSLTLLVKCPNYLKLEKVEMKPTGSFNNRLNFLLECSNDNSNFETIYSDSNSGNFSINTNKAYKYFRLTFKNPQSYTTYVYNAIRFVGKSLLTLSKEETTKENLHEACKVGQIIHIEPKEDYIIYDNIMYTLKISDSESIPIPTDLKAGKRYRLVYNGTSFEHENIYKDVQLTNAIIALGGSV